MTYAIFLAASVWHPWVMAHPDTPPPSVAGSPAAPALTPHDERRVAVLAGVDPRTVRARMRGRRQRSTVAARIDGALRELGLLPAVPAPSPASVEPKP